MRKLVVLSVVGVAAALVTSCNLFKGGEKKEAAPTEQQAQPAGEPAPAQPEAAMPAPQENTLAHTWQSACVPANVLAMGKSRRSVAMTSTGTFEKSENFFMNTCEEPTAMTYKVTGTYATLGSNPSNAALQNIDFTVDAATITVSSAATVEKMNGETFCGIADWKVDVATDITGKNCGGFTVQKGDVLMDVYKIENDNTVFFGRQFNFATSEDAKTRPESVTDAPYTKS